MLTQIAPRGDKITDPLYVIAPVFNPIRFKSRWRLYLRFKEFVERSANVVLVTTEIAFGNREFTGLRGKPRRSGRGWIARTA